MQHLADDNGQQTEQIEAEHYDRQEDETLVGTVQQPVDPCQKLESAVGVTKKRRRMWGRRPKEKSSAVQAAEARYEETKKAFAEVTDEKIALQRSLRDLQSQRQREIETLSDFSEQLQLRAVESEVELNGQLQRLKEALESATTTKESESLRKTQLEKELRKERQSHKGTKDTLMKKIHEVAAKEKQVGKLQSQLDRQGQEPSFEIFPLYIEWARNALSKLALLL